MRHRILRSLLLSARGLGVAVALVLAAATAHAYTISPVGVSGGTPGGQTLYEATGLVQDDFFELDWTLDGSGLYGGLYPDLDGSAMITITSLSATTVVIDITLSNDTAALLGDPDLQAVITVFGMEIDGVDLGNAGNILSSAGSSFDTYDEGNLAGGFTTDVCASTDAKCNKGDPQTGIGIGESDSFQLTLQGTFDTANLTLRNFGTKWQTNYGDIVEGEGNSSFQLSGGPPTIPEPATATLLGLGLVGLAFAGRRRPL